MGVSPPITAEKIEELFNLEADGDEALVADFFMSGSFSTEAAHSHPFGLNVAFADGRVKWRPLGKDELDRCQMYSTGTSVAMRDVFAYLYFRALPSRDFSELDQAGFVVP